MYQVKGGTLVSQKDTRMLDVLYRPHATTVLHEHVDYMQTAGIKKLSQVSDPTVGLHESSRAKVLALVPQVGWTGGRTACAEDALVEAIKFPAVEVGLDGLVLLVE